jgi:YggT family protein
VLRSVRHAQPAQAAEAQPQKSQPPIEAATSMQAIYFIIHTLLQLALFVTLSRLLLQLSRADFRNPISQAVVRLTNPLILPLRRVLPPVRKVDTASVVAVLVVAFVEVSISLALRGGFPFEDSGFWLREVLRDVALELAWVLLYAYFYMIFLYALLSLIAPGGYSPLQSLLASVCEPVLRPFRRLIPPLGGLDLSPLWAGIAIQALLLLLPGF